VVFCVRFSPSESTLAQARRSARPDRAFDPSAKRLGRPDLIKQPSSEAVRRLARHREKQVLRPGERMTPGVSDFTRLVKECFNAPGEFSHVPIMIDAFQAW
jgi:hypothetical protein